jgi:hypothetical protein
VENFHSNTEDMMDNIRTDLRKMRFEHSGEMELLQDSVPLQVILLRASKQRVQKGQLT